jgi:hypothetical protein
MNSLLIIYGIVECIIFIALLLTYLGKGETWPKRKRLIIIFFIIWGINLIFLMAYIIFKVFL